MLKRESSYFKHIFCMVVNNPLRIFLSVLGIFVAMLIFALGNIMINSYYDGKFEGINEMDNTSVMLKCMNSSDNINDVMKKVDYDNFVFIKESKEKELLWISEKENVNNKNRMILSASVIGVSKTKNGVLPVKVGEYKYVQAKTNLKKGRYINVNDVFGEQNVVVIDELTEKIIFGTEDSIGKDIKLNVNYSGTVNIGEDVFINEEVVKLKVVGVVENSYYEKNEEKLYEKFLDGVNEDVYIETVIYCPVSHNTLLKEENNSYYMWNYEDDIKYNSTLEKLKGLQVYYMNNAIEMDIYDKETLKVELQEEMHSLKIFVYAIIIVLVIIAGISTMNIMFFSIKERINEIGIKKALGATKLDIVLQFIIEGQIIGMFASVLAVAVSSVFARLLEFYINNELYIYFQVHIGFKEIMLPISLGILYSFVFSIIPSIYGANINVTKALRFE